MAVMRFEFRVDGRMSQADRDGFTDMRIREAPLQTVLEGEVVDESHLYGIIAQLEALGIIVVSMRQIPD